MQGRLRNEKLSVRISTSCGHCGQPMQIELDSDMRYRVDEKDAVAGAKAGAKPVIFSPMGVLNGLQDPSIIDVY